eukprot:6185255-Pleurochrysis_carterae.AAC.1
MHERNQSLCSGQASGQHMRQAAARQRVRMRKQAPKGCSVLGPGRAAAPTQVEGSAGSHPLSSSVKKPPMRAVRAPTWCTRAHARRADDAAATRQEAPPPPRAHEARMAVAAGRGQSRTVGVAAWGRLQPTASTVGWEG